MGKLNKNANLYTRGGRLIATSEQLGRDGFMFNPSTVNKGPNRKERRVMFSKMRNR